MTFSRRNFVAALLFSGAGTVALGADKTNSGGGTGTVSTDKPVFVIATIEVKPGKRDEFIKIFKGNVPNVIAEKGCMMYAPTIDFPSEIPVQIPLRDNVMTVVEQWASIEALRTHLAAPHMNTYRAAVKDLVEKTSLQVLQPA